MTPVFNGHTWIVTIVSIVALTGIGIYTEYELFKALVRDVGNDSLKVIETCGIAFIPYSVVKGIIHIIERLTKVKK